MIKLRGMKIGLFLRPDAVAVDDLDHKIAILHFAFRTGGTPLDQTLETLRTLGVTFEGSEDSGIARSLFLTNPDGHQVEITTYHDK